MAFIIEKEIWEQFPGLAYVVAHADGIDAGAAVDLRADVEAEHADLLSSWTYPNPQSHPHIGAWRSAFRDAMGVSGGKFPSAVEALVRRVVSGKGVLPINPIVDFYNLVSVRHVVPVGGWDVDSLLGGDIVLRHTRQGETFTELGGGEEPVAAGEVCYSDAEELITRHFVWRQSEHAKVTPATRRLFLVSEILPEVGAEVAQAVRSSFVEGLKRYFGVDPLTAVVTDSAARWEWGDEPGRSRR